MTPPLRILHVDTERTWRGGEQQALSLMLGLRARGQESVVACLPGSAMEERARDVGLAVLPVKMRGEGDLRAAATLRRFAKGHRIDVMHAHTAHAHTLVSLAGRSGVAARVVSRRVDFAPKRGVLGLASLKYRVGVERFIAISHAIKEVLVRSGVDPRLVSVVPSGVDPDRSLGHSGQALRFDLGLSGHTGPIVGTLAALAGHKGIDVLVDATAHLVERVPDVKVVVLGEGKERQFLEAQIARRRLQEHVLLPGFLPRAPEFLNLVDVYTAPSIMEGLNTSLADALAARRPVVASRVGGIPELVVHEETGLLVPAKDPAALADALELLIRDPERGRRYGDAGRRRVETMFSVDTMVAGNLAVYRELVATAVEERA